MEPSSQSKSGEPAASKKSRRSRKLNLSSTNIIIALLLIVVIALGALYYQQHKDVKRLSNPQEAAKQDAAVLEGEIGKLTILPTGETPTVATVSDINKLKGQAFFVNAQNGDKVLIYTTAKKAYLYRPSTNKLINIAPVNIGDQSSNQ